uniref:Uncharacterized protein n=1 Tax=Micrurus corallinus TaxID=54390 RepID=A0A2D4FGD8_MICCO
MGLFFQLKSTPDLLRDQQEVAQPGSSEYTKELIYSILKDRSTESDATAKRKTNLIFEKIQAFAAVPSSELRGSITEITKPKAVEEPDSRTKVDRMLLYFLLLAIGVSVHAWLQLTPSGE